MQNGESVSNMRQKVLPTSFLSQVCDADQLLCSVERVVGPIANFLEHQELKGKARNLARRLADKGGVGQLHSQRQWKTNRPRISKHGTRTFT